MPSMTRQAGILSSVDSIRFILKSIIGIVLARLLSQNDYGTYRQLFLIYGTVATLLLVGIPQSMLYFLPKIADEKRKAYISKTVDMVSVLAIVFTLLILLFNPLISSIFKNSGLKPLLMIFCVYPIFMFVNQLYSFIMLGMQDTRKVITFNLFSIFTDLILIAGIALLTRSLLLIVCGVVISAFVQWIFVRIQLSKHTTKYSWDKEYYKEQLKYSVPLGLSSIIGMLTIQLDKLVISSVFTPAAFAVFSIGAMELPFIGIITNSVNSVILPVLSRSGKSSEAEQVFRGSIRKNALLIFPITIVCFFLAADILTFLYGKGYSGSAPYFRIYLITLLLRVASYGIVFQALNKNRYILINAIATLVGNLILNLILVYSPLGMRGPAIATVIVTYLSTALYLFWMHRDLNMKLTNMFPLLQLGKTFLAALIAGGALAFVLPHIHSMFLRLILGASIFGTAYLAFALVFKAILPYDIQTAKAFLIEMRARIRN